MTVADVGTVIAAAPEALRPKLAKKSSRRTAWQLIQRDLGQAGGDRLAWRTRSGSALRLLGARTALVAGALGLAPDKRRWWWSSASALPRPEWCWWWPTGSLRSVAVGHAEGPRRRAAAGAVWDAFLATSTRRRGSSPARRGEWPPPPRRSSGRWTSRTARRAAGWVATEPEHRLKACCAASASLVAGLLVIVERDAVLAAGAHGRWCVLIYVGVSAILGDLPPGCTGTPGPARAVAAPRRGTPGGRRGAAPAAALIAAAHRGVRRPAAARRTAAPADRGVRGHTALCGRSLTGSRSPRPTTRCRSRSQAGIRPSRTVRSAPSCRTASADC